MPPYWEYRLRDGAWRELPLSAASLGRKANLLQHYLTARQVPHVTAEIRRSADSVPTPARTYREIYGGPDQYFCGEGQSGKL